MSSGNSSNDSLVDLINNGNNNDNNSDDDFNFISSPILPTNVIIDSNNVNNNNDNSNNNINTKDNLIGSIENYDDFSVNNNSNNSNISINNVIVDNMDKYDFNSKSDNSKKIDRDVGDEDEENNREGESTPLIAEQQKDIEPISIENLDGDEEYDEDVSLQDFSSMIVSIIIPVSLTMIAVVFLVKYLNSQTTYASSLSYGSLSVGGGGGGSDASVSGSSFLDALIVASIVLGMIILTTVAFVLLYKYRCLKILYGWLFLSVGMMLGSFGSTFFEAMLVASNLPLDYVTFWFLIFNFTVCGIIGVFWYSHQYVNQLYLVIISVLMAISLTRLPQWTIFTLLVIVAIYDLFAVLCPRGPLKVLVELSQERNENIPALVYETGKGSDSNLKLGLGDFIFYSLLISRAALVHMSCVFSTFVAILTGLFLTLLCLAIFKKALPALPISIFLGILFYYISTNFLTPFIEALTMAQVFV